MKTLRLKYLDNQIEKVRIPTAWKEVPFHLYVELLNDGKTNELKRVSILTGISCENLLGMGTVSYLAIRDLVSFCLDTEQLQKTMFIPEELKTFDVGMVPWGDLEKCKDALTLCSDEGKEIMNAGPLIVKTLFNGLDITNQPITETFGIAYFFLMVSVGFCNASKDYPNTNQSQTSLMRGLKNYLSSVFSGLWTPSRAAIHVNTMKSSTPQPRSST